jgi:hypothetical protein
MKMMPEKYNILYINQLLSTFNCGITDEIEKINNFLTFPEIQDVGNEYYQNKIEQSNSDFNIFSIISENYHYENYHSDILNYLFSVNIHKNNDIFDLFIDTLNINLANKIKKENYQNFHVKREYPIYKTAKETKGSIDILIFSEHSKHAIIIENKINNAQDQRDQLDDYYTEIKKEYEIDAIIYLSFDGTKKPDNLFKLEQKIKEKLILLSAASVSNSILSWLNNSLKTLESNKSFVNLYTFIYQYIKLLQNMSNQIIENSIKEKFFDTVKSDIEKLKSAYAIKDIVSEFDNFLIEKVKNQIPEYFSKTDIIYHDEWYYIRYEKNCVTYDICRKGDINYLNHYIIFISSKDKFETTKFLRQNNLFDKFKDGSIFQDDWHYYKKFDLKDFEQMIEFSEDILKKINA